MSRISSPQVSLAALVLQALCAWQPASAAAGVVLPTNLISPNVPHDVAAGSTASVQDLAIFAWQEFIALNWPALDPATSGTRASPDTNANFLTIAPDANGSYPLLVWQTYMHKNELFPYSGSPPSSFDSNPPRYSYKNAATGSSNAQYNLYNNLDESSEIGLCNMYAHTNDPVNGNIRIVYEAKANRAVFNYVYGGGANALCKATANGTNDCSRLNTAQQNAVNTLSTTGGLCQLLPNAPNPTVSLPCGDLGVAGDSGEGAIEIKAAWRQLTATEQAGGRFFMREAIYYKGGSGTTSGGTQQYYNGIFGLVALHIIHKTKSFPAFVFATWEQVDNYDDATHTNSEFLGFINTGTNLPDPPVARAHPIHSQVAPVNDAVHTLFMQQDPNTVWQYYKLVGVQAQPMNSPLLGAPSDDFSYYYLANIVVETNQTLQNFSGSVSQQTGTPIPFKNVYLNGAAGSPFQMGGCQGCHGTQGQVAGGDFSAVVSGALAKSVNPPLGFSNTGVDSIDTTPPGSVASYNARTTATARKYFSPAKKYCPPNRPQDQNCIFPISNPR